MSFAAFLLGLCCLLVGLGVGWACAFFYWPPGLYGLALHFLRRK